MKRPRDQRPRPITWRSLESQIRRQVATTDLRGAVKVVPWTAAEEKRAAARDHAYVYPDALQFHFSAKVLALPKAHRDAIVAHEIGHCLAQQHWGSSTEPEADAAAKQWLGTKICYDHAWPGKGLQVVCSRAKNPEFPLEATQEEAWDDGTTITWYSVPFPVERKPQIPSRRHDEAVVATVLLEDLIATQRRVSDRGLRKYAHGDQGDLPMVYQERGKFYIADGHHRLVAAYLRGDRVAKVRLVDLDRQSNPRQQRIGKRISGS